MNMPDFHALVSGHRDCFRSGVIRSAEWRAGQLSALKAMMKEHAEGFYAALWADLRRNRIDADWTDVQYIAGEVDHVLAHLPQWVKPAPVCTRLVLVRPTRRCLRA
jgi:aldehyde dehydrogenase (NAD+)